MLAGTLAEVPLDGGRWVRGNFRLLIVDDQVERLEERLRGGHIQRSASAGDSAGGRGEGARGGSTSAR